MIQVESCFDYMVTHQDVPYRDVTFTATVPGRQQANCRGIYLREPCDTTSATFHQVKVQPQFREMDPSLNRSKIDMELSIALISSVAWVKVPQYVVLPFSGRIFNVSVDPSGLQSGEAHLGFVSGFDSSRPQLGPLFKLPITVVRPVSPTICPQLQESAVIKRMGTHFGPGSMQRTFASVPTGCTWAEFTVTTKAFDGSARLFILHVLHIYHMFQARSHEKNMYSGSLLLVFRRSRSA